MLIQILPKESHFFDLFKESAEQIAQGAHEFKALLSDLGNAATRARKIKSIEHRADEVTHKTVELLHKTFITPLDREDIHALICKMDDILDFIEAASERVNLYGLAVSPPEAFSLADVCIQSTELIKQTVNQLSNLKNSDEILKNCVEINRLENEADHVLRAATAKLFKEETDLKQLIKLKEIYELLETVTDRCEDVANIIEGIVLEYA